MPRIALQAIAVCVVLGASSSSLHADKPVRAVAAKVAIEARPITVFMPSDPARVQFGKLTFRGGLILTSNDKDFGGISGLHLDAVGERFIAISDHGDWFTGKIEYEGTRPSALSGVEAGPLLGTDGKPLASRKWYDTEALAFDGATAYIGIERVNQIVRMDVSKGFLTARGEPITVPDALRKLPANKGIEALVHVPKGMPLAGALLALSERGLDEAGNIQGFLIGGPRPGAFSVKRSNDFDISDVILLANGDMLILERKFSYLTGVAIRIRRIKQGAIAPGALVDGEEIFIADMAHEIDNLEAMAVHRAANGDMVLTLMSDDNFSVIQRSILLQFTLPEP